MRILTLKVVIGAVGEVGGDRTAILEIGEQSYGRLLLGMTALGLLGYTVWRWVQADKDTAGLGSDAKGLVKRIGFAVSGFVYLLLWCFADSIAVA